MNRFFYIFYQIFYIKINLARCTTNNDCELTEACIAGGCQHPCDARNPCAQNAVCINTNHGAECSCIEGFHGNGFVGCLPGMNNNNNDCNDTV